MTSHRRCSTFLVALITTTRTTMRDDYRLDDYDAAPPLPVDTLDRALILAQRLLTGAAVIVVVTLLAT